MIFVHPCAHFRHRFPHAIWRGESDERCVYLTFDDGPIPEITPWLLDTLDQYDVKATFFMVGDNANRHPELVAEVVRRGHEVGNHTFHHLRGKKTSIGNYLDDINDCEEVQKKQGAHSHLFRPPHGIIPKQHIREVEKKGFQIVQWDIVTRDYNRHNTPEHILWLVKRYVRPGSIITFHDSLRSEERLRIALPAVIEYLQEQGYTFRTL